MSWYDAMRKCKEKDLDLVSITDAYHQAFLTVLVNRLGDPHWIGLSSQDVCIHAKCNACTALFMLKNALENIIDTTLMSIKIMLQLAASE